MASIYCSDTDDESDNEKILVSALCWDSWSDVPNSLMYFGDNSRLECVIAYSLSSRFASIVVDSILKSNKKLKKAKYYCIEKGDSLDGKILSEKECYNIGIVFPAMIRGFHR
jgi:hypothetical protein